MGSEARATTRVAVGAVVGLAVGVIASWWSPWQLSVLLGWICFCVMFLAASWRIILKSDSDRTAAIATQIDDSRELAGFTVVSAATASLLAVIVGLGKANQVHGAEEVLLTVTAVLAIVGAWGIV